MTQLLVNCKKKIIKNVLTVIEYNSGIYKYNTNIYSKLCHCNDCQKPCTGVFLWCRHVACFLEKRREIRVEKVPKSDRHNGENESTAIVKNYRWNQVPIESWNTNQPNNLKKISYWWLILWDFCLSISRVNELLLSTK